MVTQADFQFNLILFVLLLILLHSLSELHQNADRVASVLSFSVLCLSVICLSVTLSTFQEWPEVVLL